MISFLYKGAMLERAYGPEVFGAMVAFLLVTSHVLYVFVAFLLAGTEFGAALFTTCAAGFSGVIFGLKMVLNARSSADSYLYGIPVPTKYAAWLELLLIQLLVPQASFLGHLCGILAGRWISMLRI